MQRQVLHLDVEALRPAPQQLHRHLTSASGTPMIAERGPPGLADASRMRPPPRSSSPRYIDRRSAPARPRAAACANATSNPVAVGGVDHGRHVVAAIPDPHLGLERPVVGRRRRPPTRRGRRPGPARDSSSPRSDDDAVRRGVDLHARRPALPVATPSPRRCPTVNANVPSCLAEHPPVRIDDRRRVHELRAPRTHERAGVPGGREAELLRVGLARHRQPEAPACARVSAFGMPADREQRAAQLALPQHVQHVALVLAGVGAAEQVPRARVVATVRT